MPDYDWGYGWFSDALGRVLYGVFASLTFAIIVGLLFLLVRFLLIATKAAQLYIAHNRDHTAPRAATPADAPAPAAPSPTTRTGGPAATAVLPERRSDDSPTTPLPATEKRPSSRIARPKAPPAS